MSKLDDTKMAVAIWLLAKGKVEDRTRREQPAPPRVQDDDTPALPATVGEPDDGESSC